MQKVKTSDLRHLFNSLLDRGLKPSTVRTLRKILHGVFRFAIDDKIISENPVAKAKAPPLNKSSADSLTAEESRAFAAVRQFFHYGPAFAFQLHTGLRPEELMGLIWQDVDFEKMTVRVERSCEWVNESFAGFGPPKTEVSAREVHLSKAAMKLLEDQLERQREAIAECQKSGRRYANQRWKTG